MPRYYGSCAPQGGGLTYPADLTPLTSGRPSYGTSVPIIRPTHFLPQQQQRPLVFRDADGNQLTINNRTASRILRDYGSSESDHPTDAADDEPNLFAQPNSIDEIVKKELPSRIRRVGHHFGGNHPGKNKRQGPSVRYTGGACPDIAQLFGVPVSELVFAGMALQELKEKRENEAWIAQIATDLCVQEFVPGNGHYK